jgi:hypothetical protein
MEHPISETHAVASFSEVQSFRENPIALVAILVAFAACGGVLAPLCWSGNTTAVALIPAVTLLAAAALLGFGELRVHVRDDGLYLRLFPLTRQHRFAWETLAHCEARTYRPILEYGGWGVRGGRGGRAYNVSGNRGVQLELRDGRRLLIGSRRANELAAAIHARGVAHS